MVAAEDTSLDCDDKKTPNLAEWVMLMQSPENLATVLSVQVWDAGKLRDVNVFSAPMGKYEFGMNPDHVLLMSDGVGYPVHSVRCSQFARFKTPCFYREVDRAFDETLTMRLRDYYAQAVDYVENDALFELDDLVAAYVRPEFKESTTGFVVRDETYRHISVEGINPSAYRLSNFKGALILHIWNKNLEVEAIEYKNGTTLFVADNQLQIFSHEPQQAKSSLLSEPKHS